jgi:hypothetical protein
MLQTGQGNVTANLRKTPRIEEESVATVQRFLPGSASLVITFPLTRDAGFNA